MTIKVAKDGYDGTTTAGGSLVLIGGVLHVSRQPVNDRREVWVPVPTYDGPVEHVDTRGRPWPLHPPRTGPARGRGRGRMPKGFAVRATIAPIERGVPIPPEAPKSNQTWRWPWAQMVVGDSFLMPGVTSGSGQIATRSARDGRTYTTRIVEGGLRVWRIR